MDAIQLIEKDHATVERLFERFERADRREDDAGLKRVAREIVRELSIHAAIEEQALYPALRRAGGEDAEDDVLEALEEHHLAKLTMLELGEMTPGDERFCAKVNVLIETVRHHVEEEEHGLLPRLRKAMSPQELRDLGRDLAALKKAAPTRPHPASPDTPPGNLVTGPVAAVYDRGRDAARGLAERARERRGEALRRGKGAVRDAAASARKRVRKAAGRGRGAVTSGSRRYTPERPTVH